MLVFGKAVCPSTPLGEIFFSSIRWFSLSRYPLWDLRYMDQHCDERFSWTRRIFRRNERFSAVGRFCRANFDSWRIYHRSFTAPVDLNLWSADVSQYTLTNLWTPEFENSKSFFPYLNPRGIHTRVRNLEWIHFHSVWDLASHGHVKLFESIEAHVEKHISELGKPNKTIRFVSWLKN